MVVIVTSAAFNTDTFSFAPASNLIAESALNSAAQTVFGIDFKIGGDIFTPAIRLSVAIGPLDITQSIDVTSGTGDPTSFAGSGFTFDENGALTGGTFDAYTSLNADGSSIAMYGLNLLGTDVVAAGASASPDDDLALLMDLLSGSDLLLLGRYADNVRSGDGDDMIRAGRGQDVIRSGFGNDILQGGLGDDQLFGEFGDDYLAGNENNDWLFGGEGNDILSGGTGMDVLTGGEGVDTFLFGHCQQTDTVTDFDPNGELIWIESGAADFSKVRIWQNGDDTMVRIFHFVVRLENVTATDVTEEDFVFVGKGRVPDLINDFVNSHDFS